MHAEKIAKAKELATNLMCHPLANSDIATVEYAGETIKELCAYCDRMRQRYEDAETAMRLAHVDCSYAHRLAVMLECALLDRHGAWEEGLELLDEYRSACTAVAPEPVTHMGEPVLPPNA